MNKYQKRKSAGLCTRCGVHPRSITLKCNKCQQLNRNRSVVERRQKKIQAIKLYQKRVMTGLCTKCGEKLQSIKVSKCNNCRRKDNIVSRQRRDKLKSTGLCVTCGKVRTTYAEWCNQCAYKRRVYVRQYLDLNVGRQSQILDQNCPEYSLVNKE